MHVPDKQLFLRKSNSFYIKISSHYYIFLFFYFQGDGLKMTFHKRNAKEQKFDGKCEVL